MSACDAEMCSNWTGHGCICEVMDLDRDVHDDDPFPLHGGVCDGCGEEFNNFSGRCLRCAEPAGGVSVGRDEQP